MNTLHLLLVLAIMPLLSLSCRETSGPDTADIAAINLKKGPVVLCGPPEQEVGKVNFPVTGDTKVNGDFNFGMALLHSFEYEEAEKVFAAIIDKDPRCAMAYWGVAMSNFHPLWTPPEESELEKGALAIKLAASIKSKSRREADYIHALGRFYDGWQQTDHGTRMIRYEKAMEDLQKKYPDDIEAAVLYALALDGSADATDKSYTNQKKASVILDSLYQSHPSHPGVIHYIIHTYDYPEMASKAQVAAKKYASIAPSSAHAQHMPSHIFTRLGHWGASVTSNLASAEAARCYAKSTGLKGHWDEELHALDYLMYAYLQMGDKVRSKELLDYTYTINDVSPSNFKVAYTFSAIPARYVLENRLWKEAAALELHPQSFDWNNFAWQKSNYHFARCLGAVHSNQVDNARKELAEMNRLHEELVKQKEKYKANQVDIQRTGAEAWILWKEGNETAAIEKMKQAADMEDKTEKHPVTPGEVLPAKELLGDMHMRMKNYGEALVAYEDNLSKRPNRLNSLRGAEMAAAQNGNRERARSYHDKIISVTGEAATLPTDLLSVK